MFTVLRLQNDVTISTFLPERILLLFYKYHILRVDFSSIKINLIVLNPYVPQLNLVMF
jgi:hypothetical protein